MHTDLNEDIDHKEHDGGPETTQEQYLEYKRAGDVGKHMTGPEVKDHGCHEGQYAILSIGHVYAGNEIEPLEQGYAEQREANGIEHDDGDPLAELV
jgi:hypothetical protein